MLTLTPNGIHSSKTLTQQAQPWQVPFNEITFDPAGIQAKLLDLEHPCHIVRIDEQIGVTQTGHPSYDGNGNTAQVDRLLSAPSITLQQLGDPTFLSFHGVRFAYATGAMAGGIASEELVIALGRQRILASFGAGGVPRSRIEAAINRIQLALPIGPYAFNLIHSPSEPALERGAVDLFLKYRVRTIEASAFLDLTPNIVYYRAAGLSLNSTNQIQTKNKVIAKVSRREVAAKFLQPAPPHLLKPLVEQGLITELQATLAEKVPMADDITVEADSGGHTDNRSLVCLLPAILNLRDEIQAQYGYEQIVRVGAAGGIGTPESALAAFMMGAAYVVTGSVNQSCIEAAASPHTKQLLAQAEMPDVMMAPAADMFEMGVKLQVLKKGTLFPVRAQKLYEIYNRYQSIDEIPIAERQQLEKQIFRRSLDEVWAGTVEFFTQRDPDQITRAEGNPKRKMALIFRWYLGLSSRWSNSGEKGRELDYQIWCGPAMGAFNDWVKGSYLENPSDRRVVDVAFQIMTGAAFLHRLQSLKVQGLHFPASYSRYRPSRDEG
ncbi:PfaD family polyunsaturated fatty acid/polyketide biosynthesis protein [Phormidesmis priestleyi]